MLKTIKRAKEIGFALPVSNKISDLQLCRMLYPRHVNRAEYYVPDFYELDRDKRRRGFTKYRAWQKYCRVAAKLSLKAYRKSRFYKLYSNFFCYSVANAQAKGGAVLNKIFEFRLKRLWAYCNFGIDSSNYVKIQKEKEAWCKKMRLEKAHIW